MCSRYQEQTLHYQPAFEKITTSIKLGNAKDMLDPKDYFEWRSNFFC